eukprot:6762094-Ditylum_brightwellii.AAC.1
MFDYISLITTDQELERSYTENPAGNTDDAVKAFDKVLNRNMDIVHNGEDDKITVKDNLQN